MSNEPVTTPALPSAPSHVSRIHGCLLGGALGDSLGYALEPDGTPVIRAASGPDVFHGGGLQDFSVPDGGLHFSGGTQLTLYTADGLLEALEWANDGVAADVNACLWLAYLRWLATQGVPVPDAAPFQPPRWIDAHTVLRHRRAPESACLSGLATGEMGTVHRPVNPDADGCGAVTRSAPFGLVPHIAAEAVYKLSTDAASLTHGHPAARHGAGIFSLVIQALAAGHGLRDAAESAVGQLAAGPLHADMLRRDDAVDPGLLARLEEAIRLGGAGTVLDPEDLARELGAGRTAAGTLAAALYAVLATAPGQPAAAGTPEAHFRAAIAVAVTHSSATASVAGNILGTFYGEECLPTGWLEAVEAPDLIRGMAERLAAVTGAA